eukprot:GILK01002950.1.p1 GENE.GILK01002950.1~~GILK01002950.1.p1  ORF type:complete len:416 (+),score=93.37 GILK01002950.1:70-1317(+)
MVDVNFVHPDLGIGGAESLVVNAALGLQKRHHPVTIYTAHHDRNHCYTATKDGTLDVRVHGDFLPKTIFGRMYALCAILRMIWVSIVFLFSGRHFVVFCDQVSAVVPILKLFGAKVIFYCHYPDQLLCTDRTSLLKRIYRYPLDLLEEFTTGMADTILVNSKFTAGVFAQTFKRLHARGIHPRVLYPPIDLSQFDKPAKPLLEAFPQFTQSQIENRFLLLSLNRFERKKNIKLALETLKHIKDTQPLETAKSILLLVAGGYDMNVKENIEHKTELEQFAAESDIESQVLFLPSVTDEQRLSLLKNCDCVLYTPSNEHFGIVPVEAMYAGKPVITVNSGGPLESVKHNVTGYHCEPAASSFASSVIELLNNSSKRLEMGRNGHKRVKDQFTLDAFSRDLDDIVMSHFSVTLTPSTD